MLMKKILSIVMLSILSVNVYADDFREYEKQIEKCDVTFKQEANKAGTTAEQMQSAYNAKNCYKDVGLKIIDKHYSKNKKEMENRFINFIKSTYKITSYIYNKPDNCTPVCGTMMNVFYVDSTSKVVKEMVIEMIRGAEMHDFKPKKKL